MLNASHLMSWDDITSIYNDLNTQRIRFNFPTITDTSNPGKIKGDLVKNNSNTGLADLILDMKTNQFLASITLKTINNPAKTICRPLELNNIIDNINTISQVTVFSSNHSQVTTFSTNNGKSSPTFSSNHGFTSGFSSNNSKSSFSSNNTVLGSFTSNNGQSTSFSSNNGKTTSFSSNNGKTTSFSSNNGKTTFSSFFAKGSDCDIEIQ